MYPTAAISTSIQHCDFKTHTPSHIKFQDNILPHTKLAAKLQQQESTSTFTEAKIQIIDQG